MIGCDFVPEITTNEKNLGLIRKVSCDTESVINSGSIDFKSGEYRFSNGQLQSDSNSHSGNFSCRVTNETSFGLTIKLEDVHVGEYVEVSVWRYSTIDKGTLQVSSEKFGDLYQINNDPIFTDANGWEKLILNVPIINEIDHLVITCYNVNEEPVYFDDLSIKHYKSRPVYYEENQALNLLINDSNLKMLNALKDTALKQGIITEDLKIYVNAELIVQGDTIPVKIRFKGDWTDHLHGDKWSFRIKVGNGYSYKGMKSFSVQSPHTRAFLKEWFFHEVFTDLGLLTTRYEISPLKLNGNNLGLFAIEEHFDKQLIESKSRREGPILKIDEGGFWELNLASNTKQVRYSVPYYQAAAIQPFKQKRTIKNERLKQKFVIAQNMMYQYKNSKGNMADVFDMEALAMYHVLYDLGGIDHGQTWHNQRLYYNPITSRLEPIAYDMYTEFLRPANRVPIQGMETLHGEEMILNDMFLNYHVFEQTEFQIQYLEYLKLFSDASFLNNAFDKHESELDSLTQLLAKEYDGYYFDKEEFISNAQKIKSGIPAYEAKVKTNSIQFIMGIERLDDLTDKKAYYKETGLKAYTKNADSLSSEIECVNFHMGALNIIGYGIKGSKDSIIRFKTPIHVEKYTPEEKMVNLKMNGKVTQLFFTMPTFEGEIKSKKVLPWAYPTNFNPRLELERPLSEFAKYLSVNGTEITFNTNLTLKTVLFIPKGYHVNIPPGTQIKLANGGGILSYSPITAKGMEESHITITGISPNNYGVQVLTNGESSQFEYVDFNNLATLNYKGWTLTGALTVYKGLVDLNYCTFTGNTCEDALNLVNSIFTINNCVIESTFSDGFDADFCTGNVLNSKVINTGNDGLDFSGSTINISNATIINPGDKAVSGGEASTVNINSCYIINAPLGVVAKDNSKVVVSDVLFEKCDIVYSAFQKKDEYGPATITSTNCKFTEITNPNIINVGSTLILDGDKQIGAANLNVDSLYTVPAL